MFGSEVPSAFRFRTSQFLPLTPRSAFGTSSRWIWSSGKMDAPSRLRDMTTVSIPWSVTSVKHLARMPGRQAWQAPMLGVPEHDEPRLHFALAQSCLHVGDPPATVIEQLKAALADGTDKPAPGYALEGYALLAQQYLRSNPPDIDGAIDANMKLLNLPEKLP